MLRYELDNLKRLIYESKHERFIPAGNTPLQLSLDTEAHAVAHFVVNCIMQPCVDIW